MATFELRRPIETREPRIDVDPGLLPGTYRFALTVIDEAGNESRQDVQLVQIRQRGADGADPRVPEIRPPEVRLPEINGPSLGGLNPGRG
ncbi:MAG: hypothetical protein WBB01_16805 [Phormidesmis sp.]